MAFEHATRWTYAPGGTTPLAQQQGDNLWYIVTDHLGTPRELLDESGQLAWSNSPNVWGQARLWQAANDEFSSANVIPINKTKCPLRFPGQYYDEESGLHYNRHRYYDPETGQYLSPDPIGLAGGVRPQGYVGNPLSWIDPLGLATCSFCSLSGNTIKRGDGTELITIPNDAKLRKLTPPEGYTGDYGYEYKWVNSGGGTTTVRIHGVDPTAPSGSNASQGWVVRVMDGRKSMDINGVYHPPGIFNSGSPNYNPAVINDVHIPITRPISFPGVK